MIMSYVLWFWLWLLLLIYKECFSNYKKPSTLSMAMPNLQRYPLFKPPSDKMWILLFQIKSNHKGRGWQWTPVMDWSPFHVLVFQSGLLPFLKKKSHQQFFVKREVPCHTTKFEPCLTFGPPSYKIYPVMFIFYNSFHFFLEKPDIVEKPQLTTIIFQREKLIHSKTGYRCKSDMPCNTYERLL